MSSTALNQLRSRIGFVFQSFNLFPHLSVLDNIMLSPMRVLGVKRAAAREQGDAAARSRRPGEQGRRLSGAAVGRPAAARRHRARAGDGAAGDAVRRADQRARPRDGRRGAGGDAQPGGRRHDHDVRHPRDGLRPRGRRPRLVHGRRPASSRRPSPRPSSAARSIRARSASCPTCARTDPTSFTHPSPQEFHHVDQKHSRLPSRRHRLRPVHAGYAGPRRPVAATSSSARNCAAAPSPTCRPSPHPTRRRARWSASTSTCATRIAKQLGVDGQDHAAVGRGARARGQARPRRRHRRQPRLHARAAPSRSSSATRTTSPRKCWP